MFTGLFCFRSSDVGYCQPSLFGGIFGGIGLKLWGYFPKRPFGAFHASEDGFGLDLPIVSRLSQVSGLVVKMRFNPGLGSVFWIEGWVVFPAVAGTGLATKDLAF